MKRLTACTTCVLLAYAFGAAAVQASPGKVHAQAESSVLINATPKVVWRAVHQERNVDPDVQYSRVVGKSGAGEIVEQKFIGLPVLGEATAVTKTTEEPYRQIDYSLVRSDKFKDLSGTWTLTPVNGGRSTMLKLSSYVDVGLPFGGGILRNSTQKHIVRRIGNVKQLAEREQARLAANGQQDL